MSDDIIIEDIVLDLVEDKEKLDEELQTVEFFKFETGLTYKVELLTTKVKLKTFQFENDDGTQRDVTRYEVAIKSKCSDNSEYEGTALLPKSVMKVIFNNYSEGAVFNVSKTGKGRDTEYNVTKDF